MVSLVPEIELILGKNPSAKWEGIFRAVLNGRLPQDEVKRLLLLLAKRGEAADEVRGCVAAVRKIEPPRRVNLPYLIDVCGTGGDGAKTFNISTVSGFVVAAAGAYVAKHGNRAVSSRAGSSDLMEALGIEIELPFERMLEVLRRAHFGYFHAPFYHPSFSRVQGVRRELKVRTIFNLLGPLVNPVEIRYQMVGVSNPEWMEPLGRTLMELGRERAVVFRSRDGLDELSTREVSDILYIDKGRRRRLVLNPRQFGFSRATRGAYEGGDLKRNREIAVGILQGRHPGPREEVVALNSGFALWIAGLARSVEEGIQRSRWTIRAGRAWQLVEMLRRLTQEARRK